MVPWRSGPDPVRDLRWLSNSFIPVVLRDPPCHGNTRIPASVSVPAEALAKFPGHRHVSHFGVALCSVV